MVEGLLSRLCATLTAPLALALVFGGCSGESQPDAGGSGGSGQASGGTTSGGSKSSGGAGPDCTTVRCAAPTCPNGEMAVTPAGECCPACPVDPKCANVDCQDMTCPAGTHLETLAGRCCPECISDDPCEAGKMKYDAFFEQRTTELDAFSCSVNEDCRLIPTFICRPGCYYAFNVSSDALLQVQLSGAALDCLMCPDVPVNCPAMQTAVCTNGACEVSPQ